MIVNSCNHSEICLYPYSRSVQDSSDESSILTAEESSLEQFEDSGDAVVKKTLKLLFDEEDISFTNSYLSKEIEGRGNSFEMPKFPDSFSFANLECKEINIYTEK